MLRTTRPITVVCGTAVAVLLLAVPASAHVTAHSTDATSGGHDAELTFRVPNEQGKASTTTLQLVLPADKPLAGVLAAPKAGWSVAITRVTLKTPIVTDDGKVTTAVPTVTWPATAGGTGPGQYDDFDLTVGQLPTTDSVSFKAIQTYSNGTVVRWIEQPAPGATTLPEHPAPTLVLAPSSSSVAASVASPSATASAMASVTASPVPAVMPRAVDDSTAKALGGTGLGVAVLAALLALAALVRGGRKNQA